MAALPFCQTQLRAALPSPEGYPRQLVTIGDHLRKRRLDLGLSQPQVAKRLGVCLESVLHWELGRTKPELRFLKRLWEFIGMRVPIDGALPAPLTADAGTIGERIRRVRRSLALTQSQFAKLVGIDPCTVQGWEAGRHQPQAWMLARLRRFLPT